MERARNRSRAWLEWLALLVVVAAGVLLILVWAQMGRLGRSANAGAATARERVALQDAAALQTLDVFTAHFRRRVQTLGANPPAARLVQSIDATIRKLRARNAAPEATFDIGPQIGAIQRTWNASRADRYPGNTLREEALGRAIVAASAALEDASGLAYDPDPAVQNLSDALFVDIPKTLESITGARILAENAASRGALPIGQRFELAVLLDRAKGARRELRAYARDATTFSALLGSKVLDPAAPTLSPAGVGVAADRTEASLLRRAAAIRARLDRILARRVHNDTLRATYARWLTWLAVLLVAGLGVVCEELIRAEMRARSDRDALRDAQAQLAREKTERALRLTEAQYRAVFDGAAVGIAVLDRSGKILDANGAFKHVYGEVSTTLLSGRENLFAELMSGKRELFEFEQHAVTGAGLEVWTDSTISLVTDDTGTPAFAICMFRDLSELKRNERRMLHGMTHDALTGLPNRVQFETQVRDVFGDASSSGERFFAVLFVDLDRFRDVNESLGHDAGDFVLSQIGARIRGVVSSEDIVARLSSDEFAVLLCSLSDILHVETVARRILGAVAKPVTLRDRSIIISTSIGIAVGSAAYERSEDVLRDADIALRNAKGLGGSRYALFDSQMETQAGTRLQVTTDLRLAIQRGEFHLVYQPIVSIADGEFTGCEALLRWRHPTRGTLLPSTFLPLAEQMGLAPAIGRQVLQTAFEQLALWKRNARMPAAAGLVMNVNVSPTQLLDVDFEAMLSTLSARFKIDPREITIEITESVLLDPGSRSSTIVERLRARGFKIAIDDFGTGYSSLRYLQQFTVDSIKIDRSFVGGADGAVGSEPIIRTLLALAEAFDVRVVAEGVESRRQRDLLENLGCAYAQGYYYSRPLPPSDLARMYPRIFGGSASASA